MDAVEKLRESLRRSTTSVARRPASHLVQPDGTRMNRSKILIVEDERLVAEDLRDSLVHVGYDVVGIEASAEKAIARVTEVHPDLVLMDVNLIGEMDGITAGDLIRNEHGTPVVYVTAFSNNQTLARARATDAFGYIVKPFQEKAVIATIEMALGKREKERTHLQHEEVLRSGLMTLPLGVIMTDGDDRIVFANATARLHIGRSLELGDRVPLTDVFTRALVDGRRAEAGVATDAAEPVEEHGAITEMTGRRLHVIYSEEQLVGDHGTVIGRIIVYQDATHPPFPGELGRLLRSYMQSTHASPNSPAQFVTICAWSKRIKVDDATWVSFEDFLTHYLGLHVTHGMSPQVAQKWVATEFGEAGPARE